MYVFLSQVRVSLYKDGSEILSMVFDASNSDSENWFSKDRIIYVPWTDLRTEKTNVFDVNVCCGRAFSIFRNYGGCGNDAGWLVITGMNCGWENRFPKTTVMYSKLGSHVDLNDFGKKNRHDIVTFLLLFVFDFLFSRSCCHERFDKRATFLRAFAQQQRMVSNYDIWVDSWKDNLTGFLLFSSQ